jgi:hypothetical protein
LSIVLSRNEVVGETERKKHCKEKKNNSWLGAKESTVTLLDTSFTSCKIKSFRV